MIEIYADMREERSGVIQRLREMEGYRVEVKALPTGDYVISPDVVIERKSAIDFVNSIMDSRIFEQIAKMKINYKNPIVLIEGDPFATRSKISEASLIGAISYINAIENVSILMLNNEAHTASMIATMARHRQVGLGYEVPIRVGKPKSSSLSSRYIVEGLPGIGGKSAKKLLTHFGSPLKAVSATVEELTGVKGIGKDTAQRIYDAMRHEETEEVGEG